MAETMKQRALVVADQLLGTCKSLSDFATEDETEQPRFLRRARRSRYML